MQDMEYASKTGVKVIDSSFHVEENGEIIVIKKPPPEKFPRVFPNPVRMSIGQETQLVQESDFNREVKEKMKKGLIQEESLESIETKLDKKMIQMLKDRSVIQTDQFTNIGKYFKAKNGVEMKDDKGQSLLMKTPSQMDQYS